MCGPASTIRCHTIWHQVSLIAQAMVQSVVSIIIGRYNFLYRSNKAMFYVMVKAYMHLQNILLFRVQKEFILIIMTLTPIIIFGQISPGPMDLFLTLYFSVLDYILIVVFDYTAHFVHVFTPITRFPVL